MARVVAREGKRSAAHRTTAAASRVQRQFSHDAILRGIEAGLVKRAIEEKLLRLDEVHRLIPASTLARKVRERRKLSRDEADRSRDSSGSRAMPARCSRIPEWRKPGSWRRTPRWATACRRSCSSPTRVLARSKPCCAGSTTAITAELSQFNS